MKKHGKLLLLMALICACLMMCACESCKVTGDFRLNGDGSGERHISIHIPRVTAEGGESASYYYLKKHGDELAAWAEDCYALHVPETTGWLKASTQENAEEEILTLSFSFSSFEEYLTRLDLLISAEYPYTPPTMEAVDGKVVRYTEGADVLPAVFHTLENWFYSDETMFDLKATKPDGTQLNTQYSQADIAGSSLSPIDRTMQAVMTVTIDGEDYELHFKDYANDDPFNVVRNHYYQYTIMGIDKDVEVTLGELVYDVVASTNQTILVPPFE